MGSLHSHIRDYIRLHPKKTAGEIAWLITLGTDLSTEDIQQLVERHVDDELRRQRNAALNAALGPNRSPKREAQSAAWSRMITSIVKTENGDIRIGNCNRGDLEYLIAARRSHIAQVEKHITYYQQLIDLLDLRGVTYVRELSNADLEGLAA